MLKALGLLALSGPAVLEVRAENQAPNLLSRRLRGTAASLPESGNAGLLSTPSPSSASSSPSTAADQANSASHAVDAMQDVTPPIALAGAAELEAMHVEQNTSAMDAAFLDQTKFLDKVFALAGLDPSTGNVSELAGYGAENVVVVYHPGYHPVPVYHPDPTVVVVHHPVASLPNTAVLDSSSSPEQAKFLELISGGRLPEGYKLDFSNASALAAFNLTVGNTSDLAGHGAENYVVVYHPGYPGYHPGYPAVYHPVYPVYPPVYHPVYPPVYHPAYPPVYHPGYPPVHPPVYHPYR